jgi:hypothetical protein
MYILGRSVTNSKTLREASQTSLPNAVDNIHKRITKPQYILEHSICRQLQKFHYNFRTEEMSQNRNNSFNTSYNTDTTNMHCTLYLNIHGRKV